MYTLPASLRRRFGVLLGVLALTLAPGRQAAAADPPPGSVHRMVIQEGPNRSVHYVTSGNLSTRDSLAAYDLERTENEFDLSEKLATTQASVR